MVSDLHKRMMKRSVAHGHDHEDRLATNTRKLYSTDFALLGNIGQGQVRALMPRRNTLSLPENGAELQAFLLILSPQRSRDQPMWVR